MYWGIVSGKHSYPLLPGSWMHWIRLSCNSVQWKRQQLGLLPRMETAPIPSSFTADESVYYLWSLDYTHPSAFGQVYKNKSAHQSFLPRVSSLQIHTCFFLISIRQSLNPQMGLSWRRKGIAEFGRMKVYR